MRQLLKVLLPPLIAFAAFLVIVKYNMAKHDLELGTISDGNIYSLMAYFRLFAPLPFVVALLTQYLIVVPLWDWILKRSIWTFLVTFFVIAIICLVFAAGVSYTIWEQEQGIKPFYRFIGYFALIQVNYWALIFLILYLLDINTIHKAKMEEPG